MDQDDMPQPIGVSARQVTASLNGSGALTHPSRPTNPIVAIERAKLLAGCYRKDDAADPETYLMALSAVLAEYSPEVVHRVTDPRSGLPSRSTWLPSVKEVRDACEELEQHDKRLQAIAARTEEQLRERRAFHAKQAEKPTYDQLREKYGPNWGLNTSVNESAEVKAARLAVFDDANRRVFEAERAAHGQPEDGAASPSLAALIRAGMA